MENELVGCGNCNSCGEDGAHEDECCGRTTNRSQKMKTDLFARLNRIEGQVRVSKV